MQGLRDFDLHNGVTGDLPAFPVAGRYSPVRRNARAREMRLQRTRRTYRLGNAKKERSRVRAWGVSRPRARVVQGVLRPLRACADFAECFLLGWNLFCASHLLAFSVCM